MKLSQHFKQAVANLTSAKLRSFLATLGILVGTGSVVALVFSGELATQKALEQFKSLGTDLMAISMYEANPGQSNNSGNTFDEKEAYGIYQEIDEIREIAPYVSVYNAMNYNGKKVNGNVIGATDSLQPAIKIELQRGRFISFMDKYSSYCVIGQKIYQQIKKTTKKEPIGTQITLGSHIFTIVGIAKKWPENTFFNSDVNKAVIIPIAAASVLSKYAKINNMVLRLTEDADIDLVQAKITRYINTHAPGLRLFFRSASQLIERMESQNRIFTLLLGLIGGISLIVGGIGVMNVMLVSVAERRREIGIRMAVGARRRDIRTLFFIEAIMLAIIGGVLGIGVGVGIAYVVAQFSGWGFQFFYGPPILGFIVSVTTGVFFGFYPAHRAAKLDPIETLRYE